MSRAVQPCKRHPKWEERRKYEKGQIVQFQNKCWTYVGRSEAGVASAENHWKEYKHPERRSLVQAHLFEFGERYHDGDVVIYRGIRYEATEMIRYAHQRPHRGRPWIRCPDNEQDRLSPLPLPDRLAMLEF